MLGDAEARRMLSLLRGRSGADLDAGELHALASDYRYTREALEYSSVGVAVLDAGLRYRYVNAALATINGAPAEAHIGRTIAEVVPDINVSDAEETLRAVLGDGVPRSITVEGTTASDESGALRWWHNAYHRLDDAGRPVGLVAMILEITEDRRIRRALAQARTRLALLDRAATEIGTTLDVQKTCEELTWLLVPGFADLAAVDVLDLGPHPPQDGSLRIRRLALTTVPGLSEAGRLFGAPGAVFGAQPSSAVARCISEQRPIVSNLTPVTELRRLAPQAGRVSHYLELGMHSACHVPLTAGRDVIGVAVLVRSGERAAFGGEDVKLIADLVRRAASSIGAAQQYTEQRDTSVLLQRALLSNTTSPHATVECANRYLPSGTRAEVGGDWYDTIALPGGITLLVVGDAMGHGLDAAATMSEYRAATRALAVQEPSPATILTHVDLMARTLGLERLATCLIAAVDPATGTAALASAGHLPPLAITPRGARVLDLPPGAPLGAGAGEYRDTTVPFPPGSALLMYSDGLVERRGEDIDEAVARLAALSLDPAQPLEHLLDTVLSGLAAERVDDDIVVLAARLREPRST